MTKYCNHGDRDGGPKECVWCLGSTAGASEAQLPNLAWHLWQVNGKPYGRCGACKKGAEPYMVKNRVWRVEAKLKSRGFMCLTCLSLAIKRPLVLEDFTDAPINFGCFLFDIREYLTRHKNP